jgi:hypothetical protein
MNADDVWSNTIPRPVLFDGTMVQSAAGLEGVINNAR